MTAVTAPASTYRGRFAPSPTGLLHQGSLLTAVASFLDARQHEGTWLVRMEDLDPPREQPGAASAILHCLEAHGLYWDETVVYQSQRLPRYQEIEHTLSASGLAYRCNCSRRQIEADGGVHAGHCLRHPPATGDTCAIRLKTADLPAPWTGTCSHMHYDDLLQGRQQQQVHAVVGDFVIWRRDGLCAYQLAVVVDDIDQHISHVIRGCDLLDNTPRQLWLYRLLQAPAPHFGHVPVIVNSSGQKLSKQTFAPALDPHRASANLNRVLHLLRHPPPPELHGAPPAELLQWAVRHWQRERLQHCRALPAA